MDKKIKALFFDIDGTLVSFKTHKIPQSTVDALEQAKKNGVEVTRKGANKDKRKRPENLIIPIRLLS